MEMRKIQKTGGSSYIICLPKSWIVKIGLKEGDSVLISQAKDGTLILDPKPGDEMLKRRKSVAILERENPEHLLRKLIGAYLAGYSLIEIDSKERISPEIRKAAREFTRMAMGPEIIEETKNSIVLQDISDPAELPQDKCLRRMYVVVRGMHDDAILALKDNDTNLAEDVISRDAEIDKLYWMIAKQYNLLLTDTRLCEKLGSDAGKSLNFKLAAKILERIGDHAAKMSIEAKNLHQIKSDRNLSRDIVQLSQLSLQILDRSVKALFAEDVPEANASIDMGEKLKNEAQDLVKKIQRQRNGSAVHLVSIIESVRRTGLYATDISEIAINYVMGLEKNETGGES